MPLAEHQLANVPEITRTRVKHLILDGSACALHRTRGVLWSIKKRNGQTETVDAPSSGQDKSLKRSPKQCGFADYLVHRMTDCAPRLGPLPAAPLNGTFIQIFKLNDYHGGAPAHSVDVVLPFIFCCGSATFQPWPFSYSWLCISSHCWYRVPNRPSSVSWPSRTRHLHPERLIDLLTTSYYPEVSLSWAPYASYIIYLSGSRSRPCTVVIS